MSKKLEQKQQRRALEEARQAELKAQARKRNLITLGVIGLVLALVVFLILSERDKTTGPVGVAAQEAGCGEIQQPPEAESANHVEDGTPVNYASNPPTSGDHYAQPADARFYPPESVGNPPAERVVHNLEHGQIVIWYDPAAPSTVIDEIEGYMDNLGGNQVLGVLAVPYEQLGEGNFAAAAWGAYQACERVSEEVLDEFRAQFQGKGPENVGVPTFSAGD
ncbi:MAG TPA: DUF3105 domain-containing protein [Actinomycetota bacterium]|jgi:hypothetical protein|nr:DUF3105 domain-containing protein [Actinomycetota bacterium]